MAEHGLAHAKVAAYEKAFAPLVGAKVHWQLHSWGGEVSSVGYVTPSGSQPPRAGESQIGRTRLISRTLGEDADLWTVMEEGWPVVVCLARYDRGQPRGQFIRDDDRVEREPVQHENVTLEGTLWGVRAEGDDDLPTVWLHDCAVTATTQAAPCAPAAPPLTMTPPAGPTRLRVHGTADLVAGLHFTCAIRQRGEVWCWGLDVADPRRQDGSPPVRVAGVTGAVELAAGDNHVCARRRDGRVWCWGSNRAGELGHDQQGDFGPRLLERVEGAQALAAGRMRSCALDSRGNVTCWGIALPGAEGSDDSSRPQTIAGLAGASALAIGAGHVCALRRDGSVWCWQDRGRGRAKGGRVPGLADVVAIVAGEAHTCALRRNGSVVCWGYNGKGQLGNGTVVNARAGTPVAGLGKVTALSAGMGHTCAVAQGKLACFGDNEHGQLGDGSLEQRSLPVLAALREPVVSVAAGGSHTCAKLRDGRVLCFGLNMFHQGGVGDPMGSSPVVDLPDAEELSAGFLHTCARRRAGEVVCWGHNQGQVTASPGETHNRPVAVSGLAHTKRLASGDGFACAIEDGGQVVCWGAHPGAAEHDDPSPRRVAGIDGAQAIAAGDSHVCVVHDQGRVACFGKNWNGQLGDGTTTDRRAAVPVPGVVAARALSLANGRSCAIVAEGQLYCWGRWPVGDGEPRLRAEHLAAAGNVAEVAVGLLGGCVRHPQGEVSCWGEHSGRESGPAKVVRPMPGLRAVEIAAGNTFACARRDDGHVVCWGGGEDTRRLFGEEGYGPVGEPREVPNLATAVEVTAGGRHACARRADGHVLCWGENTYGQLGTGHGRYDALPVQALGPRR
jgi:alpha-tubulin suppressor-like RCC1 family protein